MDRDTATVATNYEALTRFARALHARFGATDVYLFGSRARGDERRDSDYDFIVVSPQFKDVKIVDRGRELYRVWQRAGGYGPIDLICLTPDEFETARRRITLVAEALPEAVELLAKEQPATEP